MNFDHVFEATDPRFRNGAMAVISTLAEHGVDTIFGIPGTHNLELYRHLEPFGIRAITPRHEQGAGYGADGYGQVAGKPGVVITTSGPGLTNVITAAATAYAESRPMLVLSPGVPVGLEGQDVGLLHETKNSSAAIDHLLLWSRRTRTAEGAAAAVAEAFETFASGRQGPVHIEVPLDVLEATWAGRPAPVREARLPRAHQETVEAAAKLLAGARRPLIVAGGGAVRASAEVSALAERLGAPVLTTVNGKGVLDEGHPLSLRAGIRLRSLQDFSRTCDVIFVVGTELAFDADLWEGHIGGGLEKLERGERPAVIRVDVDPDQLHKNLRGDVLALADAAEFTAAVVAALPRVNTDSGDADSGDAGPGGSSEFTLEEIASLRDSSIAEAALDYPIAPGICAAVRAAMPPEGVLTGDSSQITYLGTVHFFDVPGPSQHLYMPGFATLGYGIPAAIGAKIARPELPVVCLLGDGAAMFSIQELMTAAELELPVVFVIIDNGGYREIQDQMDARDMPHVGVRLARPDFPALAESMGVRGRAANSVGELTPLVREGLAADRPTLITLKTPE